MHAFIACPQAAAARSLQCNLARQRRLVPVAQRRGQKPLLPVASHAWARRDTSCQPVTVSNSRPGNPPALRYHQPSSISLKFRLAGHQSWLLHNEDPAEKKPVSVNYQQQHCRSWG